MADLVDSLEFFIKCMGVFANLMFQYLNLILRKDWREHRGKQSSEMNARQYNGRMKKG